MIERDLNREFKTVRERESGRDRMIERVIEKERAIESKNT